MLLGVLSFPAAGLAATVLTMEWRLAGSVAVLILLQGYGWLEYRESSHLNLSAALKSDAQSWIPDFMPASSRNIREGHDLDTNNQWMRFEFDSTDYQKVLEACPPS